MASSDANGMVIYLGKLGQLISEFSNRICSSSRKFNFRSQELFAMLDRQGDLTQEQMLSELIYEGEIHRLLKKNIL
jgi:GntR family transcriptional regulator/MocR family aminotransferase